MAALGSSFISCTALDKTLGFRHFNCVVSLGGRSRGISREAISSYIWKAKVRLIDKYSQALNEI